MVRAMPYGLCKSPCKGLTLTGCYGLCKSQGVNGVILGPCCSLTDDSERKRRECTGPLCALLSATCAGRHGASKQVARRFLSEWFSCALGVVPGVVEMTSPGKCHALWGVQTDIGLLSFQCFIHAV